MGYLRVLTTLRFPIVPANAFLAGFSWYIGPKVCRLTRSVAPPRKPDDTPVTISIHNPLPPSSPSPLPIFATPDRPARQRQATAPWRQRVLSNLTSTCTHTHACDEGRRGSVTLGKARICGDRSRIAEPRGGQTRPKLCHSDESNVCPYVPPRLGGSKVLEERRFPRLLRSHRDSLRTEFEILYVYYSFRIYRWLIVKSLVYIYICIKLDPFFL